jgi:hypothetical protein
VPYSCLHMQEPTAQASTNSLGSPNGHRPDGDQADRHHRASIVIISWNSPCHCSQNSKPMCAQTAGENGDQGDINRQEATAKMWHELEKDVSEGKPPS